ncbi:MAG TPA: twin-arginine translocase TatA/TatE family subunit [Thermoleophilaceae bacterium]
MPNIGPLEIIIVLVIVLVIFGPKRLPELGRSMGRGMREFKDSITGNDKDDEEDRPAELSRAPVDQGTAPTQTQRVHADPPAAPTGGAGQPTPPAVPADDTDPAQPVQTGEPRG